MTEVVNVKVAYIRPRYKNLKEWMEDPNNIYIGRAGIVFIDSERYPKKASLWANPFKGGERSKCIEQYRDYIVKRIETEGLHDELGKLKGKRLGCWCKPENCHGDVLVDLIQKYNL